MMNDGWHQQQYDRNVICVSFPFWLSIWDIFCDFYVCMCFAHFSCFYIQVNVLEWTPLLFLCYVFFINIYVFVSCLSLLFYFFLSLWHVTSALRIHCHLFEFFAVYCYYNTPKNFNTYIQVLKFLGVLATYIKID